MKYSSSGIELLLFVCVFSITFGFKCDLGPSNVIFLLHSTYTISNEYFEEFKMFACSLATSFNMGRGDMSTRIGVVQYDGINEPTNRIPLDAYGRPTDFCAATNRLTKMPCGVWCKPNPAKNTLQALDYSINMLNQRPPAMGKIILLRVGPPDNVISDHMSQMRVNFPNFRFVDVSISDPTYTLSSPYYSYYSTYADSYKRYVSRMGQLYPNISIPIPVYSVPTTYDSTQKLPASIHYADIDLLCSSRSEVCDTVFACPPCVRPNNFQPHAPSPLAPPPSALPVPPVSQPSQPVPQIPFIPIPVAASSLAPQPPAIAPSSGKKISNSADYYDYEIPSDPPTLKINKTPLRDDEKMRLAIKRSNDFVEHYEYDEDLKKNGSGNGSEKQTRQKRFTGKSVQQCVCNWNNPDPRTFQSPQIRSVHIEREPKPFEIKDMVIERSGSSKILDGKSIGISKMAMLSSIPFGNNQNLLQSLQLTNGVKDGRGMPKDIHKRSKFGNTAEQPFEASFLAKELVPMNYKS